MVRRLERGGVGALEVEADEVEVRAPQAGAGVAHEEDEKARAAGGGAVAAAAQVEHNAADAAAGEEGGEAVGEFVVVHFQPLEGVFEGGEAEEEGGEDEGAEG